MHFRPIKSLLASLLAFVCIGTYLQVHAQAPTIRMLVQSSPLAGFSHYDAEASFDAMKAGDELTLVREPGNPYDVNAVRAEWRGAKLGYLPRRENRAVAMEMDKGGRIEARIARLRRHPDPRQRVLIEVYVVL